MPFSLALLSALGAGCAEPESPDRAAPPPPAAAPAASAAPAGFVPPMTRDASLVWVDRGMLVFADQRAFEQIFEELQNHDRTRADEWEASLGFVSQRQLFDQIVDAEYQHLMAPYEGLTDDELARLPPPEGHSEAYEHYLASGLIHEVPADRDGMTYDYNLPVPSLARVLNEEGFVAVGDTVYQTTPDHAKSMPRRADLPPGELAAATKSDPDRGIQVAAHAPAWTIAGNFNKNTGWPTIGSRRGYMQVWMTHNYFNPFPYKQVMIGYHLNVKSQKKNFWGNWVYASCPNEVWIWGNWTLRLDYRWAVSLGYAYADNFPRSYSYPYHPNCINNFQASLKAYSGGTMPYPASTIVSILNPNLAFWDVSITPMSWNAAVPGGSSGISLNVTN